MRTLFNKNLWHFFVLLFLVFGLSSCTSYFIRKDCESKNWYQHGYDLAMKGIRPAQDSDLNRCRKAEAQIGESDLDRGFKAGMAQYCLPEEAYKTGKRGEPLNMDLCDPGKKNILTQRHKEGVSLFCQEDSGYQYGAKGSIYRGICPPDLEKSFLTGYKNGRKKYLQQMVLESDQKLSQIALEIQQLESDRSQLMYRVGSLPGPRTIIENGKSRTDDPHHIEREQLKRDIDRKNYDIQKNRDNQKNILNQKLEYQRELATI